MPLDQRFLVAASFFSKRLPKRDSGYDMTKYSASTAPYTSHEEKPLLVSTLPAEVNSITPICEASAVSLMNITKNPKVGGTTTRHACGTITKRNVWKVEKFRSEE